MKIEYSKSMKISCTKLELGKIYQFITPDKIFIGMPIYDTFFSTYTVVDLTNAEEVYPKEKILDGLLDSYQTVILLEAVLRIEER